jgi:hypothetical protein
MEPRTFLRIEGLTALALALGGYVTLDGPLWMLLVLALAPDLAMIGYLSGPKFGSLSYNVVHTYTLPIALGAVGFWTASRIPLLVALIWVGHIGADRLLGYGLKFESGFKDTHISTQPAPIDVLSDAEQ